MAENFPEERNRHIDPGNPECSKTNEPKQTHTETLK